MFIKIFSSYPVVIGVGSASALQFRERFLKHKTMWKGSFSLVPKVVIREHEIDIQNIEELVDIYSSVIPGTKLELVSETKRWVEIVKNAGQAEVHSSIVECLKLSQLENLSKQ